MNTTDQKNSTTKGNRDPRNQNLNKVQTALRNEDTYDIDDAKEIDDNNREIAERGYTVRNGYNPNRPNPDQEDIGFIDDLNDDFHTERDLEGNNDDIYEVELEEDHESLDLDGNNLNDVNDELDNPSDDFNETEEDLEDIDQDEEDDEYVEDDVQEDDNEEDYPNNDPRKF
jgi:hypothetical protein